MKNNIFRLKISYFILFMKKQHYNHAREKKSISNDRLNYSNISNKEINILVTKYYSGSKFLTSPNPKNIPLPNFNEKYFV